MRKPHRTTDQILAILRETAVTSNLSDILRRYGISRRTYYRWKSRFGDPKLRGVALVSRLQEENARLRSVVAEQAVRLHAFEQMLAGHHGRGASRVGRRAPARLEVPRLRGR